MPRPTIPPQSAAIRLIGQVCLVLATVLAGCETAEEVTTYQIPKTPVTKHVSGNVSGAQASGERSRMIAAIILRGGQGWFFKLVGPDEPVAASAPAFRSLIETVSFSDDGQPAWALPDGWQQKQASGIRFATLVIDRGSDEPLEISVTQLPIQSDDELNYLASNINRWRGQLSLPPIQPKELSQHTESIDLSAGTATLVNFAGQSSGAGQPPMAGPMFNRPPPPRD